MIIKDKDRVISDRMKFRIAMLSDAPIESDEWKNLYFTKCGRSFWGVTLFPTSDEAKAIAEDMNREMLEPETWIAFPNYRIGLAVSDGRGMPEGWPVYAFSHQMQMPVKE